MVRMNITMPERIVQKLSKVKNKSRFIAEAVEEKIKAQEKKSFLVKLEQEYKEMADEIDQDVRLWDSTIGDGIE